MTAPAAFPLHARLSALEAENEELRDRLEFYRTIFGEDLRFPLAWGLTRIEARLLAALLSPLEVMTYDALMTALYADAVDEPEDGILKVLACRLRRKLRPYDIEIRCVWGVGYTIPTPRRAELRRALRLVSGPPWECARETGRRRVFRQPRVSGPIELPHGSLSPDEARA